jgi:hypothetical protein
VRLYTGNESSDMRLRSIASIATYAHPVARTHVRLTMRNCLSLSSCIDLALNLCGFLDLVHVIYGMAHLSHSALVCCPWGGMAVVQNDAS